MQLPIYQSEEEQRLMVELWSPALADDPEAFVLFAFPWGQKNTPLHKFKGPRKWQREVLRDIKAHIAGNKGKVLSSGVWRYTRHPNYFGEACIWFGYGCLGVSSGAWWTLISSIFMTYLLVKVTGAKLLEADIAKRRPGYTTYMQTTSGFVPWFPKKGD